MGPKGEMGSYGVNYLRTNTEELGSQQIIWITVRSRGYSEIPKAPATKQSKPKRQEERAHELKAREVQELSS